MKKHIITLALVLTGFVSLAQQQEANTLSVIGRAEIEVAPDLFDFNIRYTYTTQSMEESIEKLNQATHDMIKAITSNTKIKSDSLKTTGFNTYVNDNRYNQNKKTTYTASHSLKLTIAHEKEMIVKLLNLISKTDGDFNLNTQSYASDKSKAELEEKLIKLAFDHARQQGEMLGKAGDFKIGKVRSVNYSQGIAQNPRYERQYKRAEVMSNDAMSFGDFNIEKQKITKQIHVSYYIEH